jgi:hypothetical protein
LCRYLREQPPGLDAKNSSSPERATDWGFGPAPFQGAESNCIKYRWLLHRLISAVPPGRKIERLLLEIYGRRQTRIPLTNEEKREAIETLKIAYQRELERQAQNRK